MDKLLRFIGLITCIVGIIYGTNCLIQHFPKYAKPTLQVLGIIALIAIFIRLYLGKDWLMKIGNEFVIGSDLIKASENFLNDLPKPKNETSANLIGHLVYRFTRLGLIGLVIASIPIILLYKQNQKIDTQNELITKQNKRLDQQTYLQEAERRSSLVFLFSNIMDAIDEELKADIGIRGKRDLSPQLVGRISALSTRLKPYRYMNGDTLIGLELSPERGQLLVSLIGSDIDSTTLVQIFKRADFSHADLQNANLSNTFLNGVNLKKANLRGAIFNDSEMNECNLSRANLENAELLRVSLKSAYLYKSRFRGAALGPEKKGFILGQGDTDMTAYKARIYKYKGADLTNAVLSGADFSKTDLSNVILKNIKFDKNTTFWDARMCNTIFTGTNLKGVKLIDVNMALAELDSTNLNDATIVRANLQGVNLNNSDLVGIVLDNVDLGNFKIRDKKRPNFGLTNLDEAVVDSSGWLNNEGIVGRREVLQRYKVQERYVLNKRREAIKEYFIIPK